MGNVVGIDYCNAFGLKTGGHGRFAASNTTGESNNPAFNPYGLCSGLGGGGISIEHVRHQRRAWIFLASSMV
jgi:hypothetical protein